MKIKKFNEMVDVSDIKNHIPKVIFDLSRIFKDNGHKIFIVGGFIRDFLLGLDPLDIDLSTDSLPDETISFLKGKYKLDLVGKAFGVIIVYLGNIKIEIASFRKDETIGRHPEVKLGVSIDDDVKRRDITISAIFYDIQEDRIVDLVGGIKDIENRVIRMVGNPKDRLNEDQLRSLRVIRFACRYNFTIDNITLLALKKYTDLSKISRERIFEEVFKSYKQVKDFSIYLKYLDQFDLWEYVFPGMKINHDIVPCTSLEVYLGNLFNDEVVIDFNSFNDKLIQECFIPNEISRVVTFLIWFKDFTPEKVTEYYSKKNSYRIKNETIEEFISIVGLTGSEFKAFTKYMPTTSAQELMKQGLKGKALGDKIKEIEIEKFIKLI